MKRPLLFLFALTSLFICFLYPRAYEPDPIFPQGQYHSVTVTGQLQTYHHQANGWSLLLTKCLIRHKEQSYHCSRLLVTTEESTVPLQAGNQLSVEGNLSSFSPARNPGNFDWYGYYKSQRISYRVYAKNVSVTASTIMPLRQSLLTLRESLTLRLQQLCGPDTKTAALLTALLLGDKTLLEEDIKKQYQDGGILHILTVSGLHVSLLGGTVILLTKKMYLPPWLRGLTASLLILLYWQLCGGGISAGRAVVMFLCLTAAPLLGRTYDSLSALSLAGILLLCHSPSLLFQSNFQLSFGAVLGIHLVCPSLTTDSSSVSKKASPLLFSLGLQLTLLPITLYHFFRYPLYSLLLNLLVLPLTTPLFLLGAAGLWLTALFPALSSVAATCFLIPCRWILQIYDLLCQASLALPHASALIGRPKLLRISLYYCVLGLVCLRKQRTAPLALIALLAILLLPLPHRSLSVTFLDVGQGDCAFLETPKGTTILIDSGSSDLDRMAEERLRPFLESQGVDHLDYVFLSHTDEDHFNGIVQWLDLGGSIGTAVLPALPDSLVSSPSYQHAITLLTSYQVPILYFSQGMSWQEEELTLTCLAPVSPSHPHSSLYQDLNTASQVLLLQYQEIHILFTGDCEKEGENLLLDYLQEQNLTCHILKAGHHGSNFATSQALLTQLHPQAVIVSCGVRNRYGHPHPTMLSRTEDSGATCYVTASGGAVSVTISHGKARLKTFLSPGPLYYR